MNATIKLEKSHFPVLLDELISIISPLYGGTFIDCTFGQGGYSKKILENKKNTVIALDRDKDSIKLASKFKEKYKDRFYFENKKFSEIDKLKIDIKNLNGIVFDLGYSLNQIRDYKKGLSFNSTGQLNMKMGFNDFSAHETINNLDQKSLEQIFKFFGEESEFKRISKRILQQRSKAILKTEDLVNIVNTSKKNKNFKIHKATKIFQALRIFVNKEISELIYGLINSYRILPVGGVIAVVTFHSIEDKIVKFFFKNYSESKNFSRYLPDSKKNKNIFKIIKRKPIIPSFREIRINPQSRSAKLRYAIKIGNRDDFGDLFEKFKYLMDIENLSKNL